MSTKRQLRLILIGAAILLCGMFGAVTIYANATDENADVLAYEFVDGLAYPILAQESKAYRHDLERFGGKSAVFADDVQRWLSSLWHGKRLAYGVALIALVLALACFRAAWRQSRDDAPR